MDGNNFNNQYDPYSYNVAPTNNGNGFAIASLVFGILGSTLFCGWIIPQILAIVFAIVAKKSGQNRAMANWGLWLGIISLILIAISYIIIFSIYGLTFFALLTEM